VPDVALREPGELLPPLEFLGEVEDRPEKVGERFVFEEDRVLEQPEEEPPPLFEEPAEVRHIHIIDDDVVAIVLEAVVHSGERPGRPGVRHDEILPDLREVRVMVREVGEEAGADLREEGSDDHVQLLQPLALCPDAQELVYDQGDQEDADRQKPECVEDVLEGVQGVAEQEVFYDVYDEREADQGDPEPHLPASEELGHDAGRYRVGKNKCWAPGCLQT